MASDPKDTIYIDPEDEITTVIDKVLDSPKKLVALVLPSRATVFQSIVNMKLLKRKSSEAGKDIVLVTNESSLRPLAGNVGLHVAKTLSSKPEIPVAPVITNAMVEAAEDEKIGEDLEPGEEDALRDIGKEEISKPSTKAAGPDSDTIELDNTEGEETKPTDTAMPAVALASDKKTDKRSKKLKVPDFERFRVIAILGGLIIVVLIILWILMFKVWPHATVSIKTDAQNVNATVPFTLDPSTNSLNQAEAVVPAKLAQETKTYTATVNSTGSQNNGQTATGSVSMTAEECGTGVAPSNVPAGSEVVQNNEAYITQAETAFNNLPNGRASGNCLTYLATSSTSITAQNPGAAYNTANNNTSFSVPGRSDVSASGGVSGGTDDIVTIVAQQDITNAENKISTDTSGAKSDLTSDLTQDNFYPIDATFAGGTPTVSPNASAGTAASSVTVTETVKYTLYGVIKQDLVTLLNSNILSQVGKNQNILNNGFNSASYTVGTSPTDVTIISNAIVGPNINATTLKSEIKGLKAGAIESLIKTNSNVSSVSVSLSPFYVSTAPSPSHITINIAKPTNNPSNASQ